LALETDLKIEREWRGTLQQSLDKEKTKVAKLQADVQHLDEMKKVTNIHKYTPREDVASFLDFMNMPLNGLVDYRQPN